MTQWQTLVVRDLQVEHLDNLLTLEDLLDSGVRGEDLVDPREVPEAGEDLLGLGDPDLQVHLG